MKKGLMDREAAYNAAKSANPADRWFEVVVRWGSEKDATTPNFILAAEDEDDALYRFLQFAGIEGVPGTKQYWCEDCRTHHGGAIPREIGKKEALRDYVITAPQGGMLHFL